MFRQTRHHLQAKSNNNNNNNNNQQNSCNTVFPRDIVCLRNMNVSTLHKGDDDDNNNKLQLGCHPVAVVIK